VRAATDPVDVLVIGERRRALARTLADGGLVVEASAGVFPALSILRERPARLAVLGVEELDEHDANPIEAIRASGAVRSVLLIHPESQAIDPDALAASGADEALPEPFFPQILLRCVRDLISTHGGNGSASSPSLDEGPAAAEVLRQIHRAARDLPVLRTVLLQNLGQMTGAARASLMIHRPSSRELFLAEGAGLPPDVTVGLRQKVGRGIAGRVAERARPVVVPDIDASEFRHMARHEGYVSRSFLSVPLVADARVLGVLSFADRRDGRPYTSRDLDAILPIVDTAAAVVRNAVLIRRLRSASMLDPLTGLLNRRYFDRARQREVKRARRYDHPLSLALIDADRFKEINDAEGHPAGDETLRAIAAILKDVFRETDVICRYGGDEFAVLMPETDRKRCDQAVARLTEKLRTTPIPGESHVPGGKLGVSCGTATFPEDAGSAEDLVTVADGRLYEVKEEHHREEGG